MFSGIGGFELGIQNAYRSQNGRGQENPQTNEKEREGLESAAGQKAGPEEGQPCQYAHDSEGRCEPACVGYSEIDKYAVQIYERHFHGHRNYGDATKIRPEELPDFDFLVAGFPCQAFSIAGRRLGFEDTRGTMFFEIARIVKQKQPRLLLLENVKGLLSHDKGRTFAAILSALDELGYDVQWQVLNSKDFGVPQNRERVFIVGHRRGTKRPNVFPLEKNLNDRYNNIIFRERVYLLSPEVSQKCGLLLQESSQQEKGLFSKQQMQDLLTEIKQGIQEGSCSEIQGYTEGMDTDTKRSVQVVEELNSWASGQDKAGTVYGVVQIPTEDVLLLWVGGGESSISFRQIQQQDLSFECGQNRLLKGLRSGEFSSLLLAVQSYQGRLFYSIGNGRDWQKIYIAEVEAKCKVKLSSILKEKVDEKYFLSEQIQQRLKLNFLGQQKVNTALGLENGMS
jgi:DNA (cytosine-5)-methyltransferase 1